MHISVLVGKNLYCTMDSVNTIFGCGIMLILNGRGPE
jgi:hypothetical protein